MPKNTPTRPRARARRVNESRPNGYTIIGIYPFGSNSCRPLAANGRLVLFDTVAMAQQFLPLLGAGRQTHWSRDGESVGWTPLDPKGINRADIITGYDPHAVPVDFPGGIRSETAGRAWKHHIMWFEAFTDCGKGHIVEKNGTLVNTAFAS